MVVLVVVVVVVGGGGGGGAAGGGGGGAGGKGGHRPGATKHHATRLAATRRGRTMKIRDDPRGGAGDASPPKRKGSFIGRTLNRSGGGSKRASDDEDELDLPEVDLSSLNASDFYGGASGDVGDLLDLPPPPPSFD